MKNIKIVAVIACASLLFASCDKYLDTLPDNRAELNTPEKITSLLVSAYPSISSFMLEEMSSDNATDNGVKNSVESKVQEEAYRWENVYTDDNDGVKDLWDSYYGAISSANHALQAIEDLGDGDEFTAQKGEALICRAFAHFKLSTIFCLPYNPETADVDLGVPYATKPETQVNPKYERGTLKQLYDNIEADIVAGLPLIDDNLYTVPKYHFNRKAAYAFAARFYLYKGDLDNCIKCANEVLGSNPKAVLKDWASIGGAASNWDVRVDMYISAADAGNLLMTTAYSSWGYWGGPYLIGERYGHSYDITMNETVRAQGLWGSASYYWPARNMWGLNPQKLCIAKIGGYFQYTDKVQQIGYRMNVNVQFSTDETLLCRAEAYARKNEFDKAVEDINTWMYTHTTNKKQVKLTDIVNFYSKIKYTPLDINKPADRTVKKELHPVGFSISAGDQENLIQCILHIRRCETIHEGLRWMDIKRYGIEISHPRDKEDTDYLLVDDPRRAIQLPDDVIQAGLVANPRNF